jgi:hypothetical protein
MPFHRKKALPSHPSTFAPLKSPERLNITITEKVQIIEFLFRIAETECLNIAVYQTQ